MNFVVSLVVICLILKFNRRPSNDRMVVITTFSVSGRVNWLDAVKLERVVWLL